MCKMTSYEDSVLDFDLAFLRPTSNTGHLSKLERQKKSVALIKKKIIATNSLIGKYYAKRQELEETEKTLLESKEECKQICINYRNALDTCAKLESDTNLIQNANKQLEERFFNTENQYEAVKSHANQLQGLVNEHKAKIDTLEIENKLEKAACKENEKKVLSLQKENEILCSNILIFRDIILKKKKLKPKHKVLLRKYDKPCEISDTDDDLMDGDRDSRGGISDPEDDIFEEVRSPDSASHSPQNNFYEIQNPTAITKEAVSPELDSIDTGRGSSLAFSDNEKCFHSPDYFINNSPQSKEIIENNVKAKQVNIGTSPVVTTVEIATSPIYVPDGSLLCQITFEEDMCSSDHESNHTEMSQKSHIVANKSPSPINLDLKNSLSRNPFENISKMMTSPVKVNDKSHMVKSQSIIQEKECLDLNNSSIDYSDNINDGEIAMILNTMRLHQKLITPIPLSPSKSHDREPVQTPAYKCKKIEHNGNYICQDAVLVREENRKLQNSIADLAKEMINIKSLLKSHIYSNHTAAENSEQGAELSKQGINQILFEDNEEHNVNLSDEEDAGFIAPNIDENEDTVLCEPLIEEPAVITSSEFEFLPSQPVEPLFIESTMSSSPQTILDTPQNVETCEVTTETSYVLPHRIQFEDSMPLPDGSRVNIEPTDDSNMSLYSDIITTKINSCFKNNKEQETEVKVEGILEKVAKPKKLTSLQKLKKKLGPRYKIKTDLPAPTPRKLRMRPKQLPPPKKKATPSDTSASLNDKNVYEKAVKVMAQLKSQKHIVKPVEVPKVTNSKLSNESIRSISETRDINLNSDSCSPKSTITTRSRKKCVEQSPEKVSSKDIESNNNTEILGPLPDDKNNRVPAITPRITRKRRGQSSSDNSEIQCKRLLRSSSIQQLSNNDINRKNATHVNRREKSCIDTENANQNVDLPNKDVPKELDAPPAIEAHASAAITYHDIDMFTIEDDCPETRDCLPSKHNITNGMSLKESLLVKMIEKYGVQKVKIFNKKVSEAAIKPIYEKLESEIGRIIELPCNETKQEMNKLVAYIQSLNYKYFMHGLMRYLTQSERKIELFGKVNAPPAPPMTKSEQVLLYVVILLRNFWPSVDFADALLCNIEYTLFKLNRTPDFDVIESMSHFYAVVCRYFKEKSRLRLFVLDAMYCIQFKSVPLIKQCLDVWLHILPLAHMGIAKTPLVTCLVYLLHFYKCEDRMNRVQELRNLLKRKYFYQITEWNETKMLDMIRHAIMDVKDVPVERKMLRLALIILAKRQGTRWCQNQAIKNVLMPILERENVPERVKEFCVSMIGPLMRPYPDDMKIHCEIAMNQLIDMLNQSPSKRMENAIISSLVYMNRHNQSRVIELFLSRKMSVMPPELEHMLRDFVREKSVRVWTSIVKKTLF